MSLGEGIIEIALNIHLTYPLLHALISVAVFGVSGALIGPHNEQRQFLLAGFHVLCRVGVAAES